nr:GntR family transcriptional regulator [uncultured Flavonifractor sp.]
MYEFKRIKRNSASDQVRWELIRRIKEGYFADGTLPSEDGIAAMFGVSRITVRDALANLENLGYISRIQGKGTIVNQAVSSLVGRVSEGQPFTELIRAQGFVPSVANGKVEKVPITPGIKEDLRTEAEEMYRVEKLFLGDGMPMIFGINHFSTDYLSDELLSCPVDETLIFQLIRSRFSFPDIAYDIINIQPCTADAYLARQLQIQEGTAMLMFKAISMGRDEQPLLVNYEFYHPEKIRFQEVRRVDYHMHM